MPDDVSGHRIDIPNAKPADPGAVAFDICFDFVRSCGIDPVKAMRVPIVLPLLGSWLRGERGAAEVGSSLRKLLILNPSIALENK